VKNVYPVSLITATTLLVSACGSVQPYKEPLPDQASATLTIALGNEYGESSLSYGRADEDGCLEFPTLYASGNVRDLQQTRPAPKTLKIPAGSPQLLRYYRQIGRNASARACTINLRFEPKKDAHYLVTSDKRYETGKSKSWWSGEKTTSTEVCMVYVLELDETEGLKPVPIKQVGVNPTRFGVPGCPK
tara:strand:+ start:2745 stop:3311 length:567 start_codon:yes stop_codon:yes gene_type:complete